MGFAHYEGYSPLHGRTQHVERLKRDTLHPRRVIWNHYRILQMTGLIYNVVDFFNNLYLEYIVFVSLVNQNLQL